MREYLFVGNAIAHPMYPSNLPPAMCDNKSRMLQTKYHFFKKQMSTKKNVTLAPPVNPSNLPPCHVNFEKINAILILGEKNGNRTAHVSSVKLTLIHIIYIYIYIYIYIMYLLSNLPLAM